MTGLSQGTVFSLIFQKGILLLFLGSLMLAGYARYIEPNHVQVERVTIPIEHLPPGLAGLTIVQLSDLDLKQAGSREKKVVRLVNELAPDLIVITGDLVQNVDIQGATEDIGEFVDQLEARYGIWVVRGDDDFIKYIERSNLLLEELQASKAHILVNQTVEPVAEGAGLYLIGVDYMGFPVGERANFATLAEGSNITMATGFARNNSYAHYTGNLALQWQNYEFSGRMKYTDGGLGVTFYSRFPTGFDKFYRLRQHAGRSEFHLAPHATKISGEQLSTGITSRPHVWYQFRIQVETGLSRTVMRAKVWPEGMDEPGSWQAVGYDDSPTRITSGTIGLWTGGPGKKYFDDLVVKPLNASGPEEIYLAEDFDALPPDYDPPDWLDFGHDIENVREALKDVPAEAVTIMLVHSPDLVMEASQSGVDLVLSGSTHGGQVRLPFLGVLFTGTNLGPKYSAGLYNFGDTRLYINRGLGTSIIPMRFLSPPEITLITLTAASETSLSSK